MSLSEEIHIGDIGTNFEISLVDDSVDPPIAVDLTGATILELIFRRADDSILTKTAAVVGDATAGVIQYITTAASDLNSEGTYRIQAKVVLPSGTWRSERSKFRVHGNIE